MQPFYSCHPFYFKKCHGTPLTKSYKMKFYKFVFHNLTQIHQCEHWACLDERKLDILAGIEERHTRTTSAFLNLSLYFAFIALKLEKLGSHKYVVENGSKNEVDFLTEWKASPSQKLTENKLSDTCNSCTHKCEKILLQYITTIKSLQLIQYDLK